MKMVVGKRQIILAALIVALGAAIFINAKYANGDSNYLIADNASTGLEADNGENFGEAQLVAANASTSETMSEARLNRQKTRDLTIETLETMLSDVDLTEDEKQTMVDAAAAVALSIEAEGSIENLVMAKGFDDCMAYVTDEAVRVVVYCPEGLSVSEATQIKEIVLTQTNIKAGNISIVEVN